MALKLIRNGEAGHLQDHNLLKNLELENQHPIKSITGLRAELDSKADDSDIDIINTDIGVLAGDLIDVDVRVTEIERKIEDGEIGGGGGGNSLPSSLKYSSTLEYEGTKLIKETFVGDVNKVVDYTYDEKDNVSVKTVTRGDEVIVAKYEYDEDNNLTTIVDNGTDEIHVSGIGGFSSYVVRKGIVTDSLIISVEDIYKEEDLNGLMGIEFILKSNSSKSNLTISQGGMIILESIITDNDTQKYNLGAVKSTVIEISGDTTYELVINGIKHLGSSTSGGGSGGSIDISPLVDRVKVLEQNIVILNSNNTKLKDVLDIALNRLTDLKVHVESIEFTMDEEHKITSTKDCSFTDSLVNSDNIESLVNCELHIDTDSVR